MPADARAAKGKKASAAAADEDAEDDDGEDEDEMLVMDEDELPSDAVRDPAPFPPSLSASPARSPARPSPHPRTGADGARPPARSVVWRGVRGPQGGVQEEGGRRAQVGRQHQHASNQAQAAVRRLWQEGRRRGVVGGRGRRGRGGRSGGRQAEEGPNGGGRRRRKGRRRRQAGQGCRRARAGHHREGQHFLQCVPPLSLLCWARSSATVRAAAVTRRVRDADSTLRALALLPCTSPHRRPLLQRRARADYRGVGREVRRRGGRGPVGARRLPDPRASCPFSIRAAGPCLHARARAAGADADGSCLHSRSTGLGQLGCNREGEGGRPRRRAVVR